MNLKSTIVLFFFGASFSWLLALQGEVVNEKGEPIVAVMIASQMSSVYSDSLGLFFYAQNITKLKVSHPEYYPQTIVLTRPKRARQEVSLADSSLLTVTLVKKLAPPLPSTQERLAVRTGDYLAQELKRRFYVKGHNLPGENQELSLSGQRAKNSLVLLENIPLNMSGQPVDLGNFSSILCDSAQIDIFSPTSSMAGAGELNLYQSLAGGKSITFLQATGSYNLQSSLLQIDAYTDNYSYRFGYSHLQADNDYDYTDYWGKSCKRENNQKRIDNLSFALDGSAFKFRQVNVFFQKGLPGATNERDYFTHAKSEGYRSISSLSHHRKLAYLALDSDVGYNILSSEYDNSRPLLSGKELTAEHTFSAFYSKMKLSSDYKGWKLSMPFTYKRERFSYDESKTGGSPESDIEPKSEEFYSARLSGAYPHKTSWGEVTPEVEVESGSEQAFLPRIGVLLKGSSLSGGAFYRQTVSPASFYDRFWQAGELAQGNPDLESERARTYSSFLVWESSSFSSQLFYSYTRNEDLISWQRTSFGWKPFNIGESSTEYWELSGKACLGDYFELTGKASRTIAKDRRDYDGKYIPYIPVGMLNGSLTYKRKHWELNVDYSAIGRQYTTRDQVNSLAYLDSYDFWDVSINGNFAYRQVTLQPKLKLCNVLDEEYSTYAFDPQPGFHWQTALQVVYNLEK